MSLDPLLEEAGVSAEEVLEWARKRADALLEEAQADPELAGLAEGLEAGSPAQALEEGEPPPSAIDTERVAVVERPDAAAEPAEASAGAQEDDEEEEMEELDLDDVEELDDDLIELIDEDEGEGDPDEGEGAELAKALIAEVSTGEPAVRTGKTQKNRVVVASIANDSAPPPPPPGANAGPNLEDLAAAPVVTGDTSVQTPVAAVIPEGDDDLPDELRDELAAEQAEEAGDGSESRDEGRDDSLLGDDLDDLDIDLDDD